MYQVRSKKNGRAGGKAKEVRRPVSLIVNGLEVTIANGTAEQVGRIAAALIS